MRPSAQTGAETRAVRRTVAREAEPVATPWDAFMRGDLPHRHAPVFLQAADALAAAGDRDEAITLMERAIERARDDPRFWPIRRLLRERLAALRAAPPRATTP
jgi:predicted Zn-dependent protease